MSAVCVMAFDFFLQLGQLGGMSVIEVMIYFFYFFAYRIILC